MKKQNLVMWTVMLFVLLSAIAVTAQDKKMDMKPMPAMDMKMDEMHRSPHHKMMMAYHHSAHAFTQALWDMSSNGKIEDIELARNAFGEIKRSLDAMEAIHTTHMAKMGKMDAAMTEKMKPMMEKMEAEGAAMKQHMTMLGTALQANSPDAQDISMHAGWLLLKLGKMDM
ncbi:MAG: hypothetical protein ABJB34_03060 [Acidobacteriota bacterium]